MRPAELRRALEAAPGIEVQLAGALDGDHPLLARTNAAARALAERSGQEVRVLPPGEPGDRELPRIVLGRPADPLVRRLVLAAGATGNGERLSIEKYSLTGGVNLLQLCFEDPDRPGLPLNLIVAPEPGGLLLAVEDLSPASRPGLRYLSQRRRAVELDARSGSRWMSKRKAAPSLSGTYPRPRLLARQPACSVELFAGVDPERAAEYAAAIDRAIGALGEWLGEVDLGHREVLLVDSVWRQRELAGASDLAVSGGLAPKIWVLLAPGMTDDAGAAVARDAVRTALGDPAQSWMLDAAAFDAADRWWGRPLVEWGRRLLAGELLPPLAELVETEAIDHHSRHVVAPARALLFRYLREHRGVEALRSLWSDEELDTSPELEAAFRAWLLPEGTPVEGFGPEAHRARLEALAGIPFQRGVALGSNAGPGGGFDGSELSRSLALARRDKVNAVSLTSFFTERPPAPRYPGGRLPEGRESLEGDVALAQAFAAARRAGVDVLLLQPHLLLQDSSGYSAWLRRTEMEHWQEFFDAYDPMVVHYGLLAELCGVELVSLGTGITRSTIGGGLLPEVRELHDERWAASIELARRAFGGALTYAAATSTELLGFPHWPRLDYVGVSLFPVFSPLTDPPHRDPVLEGGWSRRLDELADVARSAGRPALIVEVGARSTSRAATEVAIGPGFAEAEEQLRVLRALRTATLEERDPPLPLAGLYFWKWSASSSAGGPTDRGFSIQHKPASAELSRFGPPE